MKLHKISLVILLVLLLGVTVVVPVAADKTVTPVTFRFSSIPTYDIPFWRLAGPNEQLVWVVTGDVTGDRPVVGRLSWEMKLDYIWNNAHSEDYHILWMVGQGKWRLEVEGGGWEGSTHLNPWVISEKWPLAVQ